MITIYLAFLSIIELFQYNNLYFLMESMFFLLMCTMAIFTMNLIGNNYPDRPVEGSQKRFFNWLFLLNFLLIAFLFGLFFSELRQLQLLVAIFGKSIFSLSFKIWMPFSFIIIVLVLHFLILYGMYVLRITLYRNFRRTQHFDFEKSP
jgi:hypothetical protein